MQVYLNKKLEDISLLKLQLLFVDIQFANYFNLFCVNGGNI